MVSTKSEPEKRLIKRAIRVKTGAYSLSNTVLTAFCDGWKRWLINIERDLYHLHYIPSGWLIE
jgi:hypothetical protein